MGFDLVAFPSAIGDSISWTLQCGEVALFWDCNHGSSLATWIALNIDPHACESSGLMIFNEPEEDLNTTEWRMEILLKARLWYSAARDLKGYSSLAIGPRGNLDILDEISTVAYIEWVSQLVRFCEIVYSTEAHVQVSQTQ